MIQVFSFGPTTKRFGIEIKEQTFYFTYDLNNSSVNGVWNEDGKKLGRTYKSLRYKSGIRPASSESTALSNALFVCKKYL